MRSVEILNQAVEIYDELIEKQDHWTSDGRANLLALKGDTYRHKADWNCARQSYLHALELRQAPVYKVFLCDCLLQLGQVDEAIRTLNEVKLQQLAPAEQVDYAFAAAALAVETGERHQLENAKATLKSVHVPDPYFRERRDSLLLNVQEALVSGKSRKIIQRTRRLLADMTRSATSYLILKPNFMGIGIDINKIFEDLSKREDAKTSKHSTNQPDDHRAR